MGDHLPLPPKIDLTDRKILYELDQDSRQSLGKIAKKVRCSKQTLHYRIRRLESEGVISGFVTAIDTAKLGYSMYMLFIELSGISLGKKKEFLAFLAKQKNIAWLASCGGKFDIAMRVNARSMEEFNMIFKDMQAGYPGFIKNHIISLSYEYHRYQRMFYPRENHPKEELFVIRQEKEMETDEADRMLLQLLSKNSRIGTNELAKKAQISPNTVRVKIKRMQDEGVIKRFTISINEKLLGIERQDMLISLRNLGQEREKELEEFCKQENRITFMLRAIGKWDLTLTVDSKGQADFQDFLTSFRSSFSDIINEFEIAGIMEDVKFDYFPI
jgi:DNA-binding Lrp family transcriptional regulator